jgi:hypothetical protein
MHLHQMRLIVKLKHHGDRVTRVWGGGVVCVGGVRGARKVFVRVSAKFRRPLAIWVSVCFV